MSEGEREAALRGVEEYNRNRQGGIQEQGRDVGGGGGGDHHGARTHLMQHGESVERQPVQPIQNDKIASKGGPAGE